MVTVIDHIPPAEKFEISIIEKQEATIAVR
jgi:hypothetical protein